MVIHVTILMITLNSKTQNNEILIHLPKIRLESSKRVSFIMEQNASMISQHRLEVLKIGKSS